MSYLCNTDEDDEDGGRAAVGPLQVLAASIFRKHPSGDGLLELLTAAHRPATVGSVPSSPERFTVAVYREGLLLLQVDLFHRCPKPATENTEREYGMHMIADSITMETNTKHLVIVANVTTQNNNNNNWLFNQINLCLICRNTQNIDSILKVPLQMTKLTQHSNKYTAAYYSL